MKEAKIDKKKDQDLGFTMNCILFLKARKIMLQVVVGLLYLHSHGILHRDLSLGNLLLTKNMDVVGPAPFIYISCNLNLFIRAMGGFL